MITLLLAPLSAALGVLLGRFITKRLR